VNAPEPVVSVVLPVYNAATHLPEAMQSLLTQTFADFEIIAVNDGSTDGSQRILEDFARVDSRVRILQRPNTGIVGALNDGLAVARADLIARMDSDDVSRPTRFEKQVAYLTAHPECVLLGAQVQVIDPHGMPLYTSDLPAGHAAVDAALMLGKGGTIRHPVAMMRRSAVESIGGYRQQYQWAEDVDLFLRLAEVGRVANLPDVLLQYRQHCASVNRTRFVQQAALITEIVREAANRRGVTVPQEWKYPLSSPPSPVDQLREWGWRALKEGRIPIARKHGISALRTKPFSVESWRLMYCALRGR
jgi:glycosyltransferase involved in cell wall biosynthesis